MNPQTSPTERIHRVLHPQPDFSLGYVRPFWTPEDEPEAPAPEAVSSTTQEAEPVSAPSPEIDPHEQARRLLRAATDEISRLLQPDDSAQEQAEFARGYSDPMGILPAPKIEAVNILDAADRERANGLLAKLSDCAQELGDLLAIHRERLFQYLLAEKNCFADQCRAQKEVLAQALRELSDYGATKRKLRADLSAALAALRACEGEGLPSWPKDSERVKWEAKRRKLQAALDEASLAESRSLEEERRLLRSVTEEKNKLAALDQKYWGVTNRMSGQPYFDSRTGLERESEL